MKKVIDFFACAGFCVVMMGGSGTGQQPNPTPAASILPSSPTPPITLAAAATTPTSCPDPMAIIRVFYDANDAARFEVSLGFLTEDATLTSWAEGVNGHHMREEHLTGKAQIRPALGDLGLRRTSGQPDGPIYHETRVQVAGDHVTFILEPDRRRPNGKPYNPYRVEAVFDGCKIKSLTVIDLVTWL